MSCRKWLRGSTIGAATVSVAILWALPSANAASGGGCSSPNEPLTGVIRQHRLS